MSSQSAEAGRIFDVDVTEPDVIAAQFSGKRCVAGSI
jgi:hypothetical protein